MTKVSSNNYQNTYSTTPQTKKHRVLKTASKLAVASAVVAGTYYAGKKTGAFDILRKKVFNNEKLHTLLNTIKTFLLGIGIGKTAFEIKDAIQEDSQNDSQKNIKEDVKAGVKEAIKETINEADKPALSAEVVVEPAKTETKELEQPKILLLPPAPETSDDIEETEEDSFSFSVPKVNNLVNKEIEPESFASSVEFAELDDEDDYEEESSGIRWYARIKNLDSSGFGHINTKDFPISFEELVFVGNRAMDENLNIISGKVADKRFKNAYYMYDDGFLKKYVCQKDDKVLTSKFSYDKQNKISQIEVATEPAQEAMDDSEWSIHPNRRTVKLVTFDRENQTMSVKKFSDADEYILRNEEEKTYDKNGKCIRKVKSHLGRPFEITMYDEKKVITYEGMPQKKVIRDLKE